jgi:hypothetical protein
MSAEIIALDRSFRYVSPDPVPIDPAEVVRLEAIIAQAHSRNVALAKVKARAPLRPKKPQEPCDVGLFSDDHLQLDLVEMFQDPTNPP